MGIIAGIIAIFVGINGLVNSEGNTHIENNNGTLIVGDNNSYESNSYKTIINKITSYFMDSPEKKDEDVDPTITSGEDSKYSENSADIYSENNEDGNRSDISVPGEDKSEKIIYDKDFSLVGKVIEEPYFSSTTNKVKGGILLIDIPDEEGKYYQINVTTDDPESEVFMYEYYTYNYEYREDKFSDFSFASGIIAGNDSILPLDAADKMRDINATIYIRPISQSDCLVFINQKGLEQRLIDRNLSIQLEIPPHAVIEKEDGDTVTSNGHIKIQEVDEEEVGDQYHHIDNIG